MPLPLQNDLIFLLQGRILFVYKEQKTNSDNYRTPLHSCSFAVTGEQARVTGSSPCNELKSLHIPTTPVAFPLVGSRAEKFVAWTDQTVRSTIIYSLFSVDPSFTVSHSNPQSNSLLAMCYHLLLCTSIPDCAATLPVGSHYWEQTLKKTKATNSVQPFWGMIQFLLQLSNL